MPRTRFPGHRGFLSEAPKLAVWYVMWTNFRRFQENTFTHFSLKSELHKTNQRRFCYTTRKAAWKAFRFVAPFGLLFLRSSKGSNSNDFTLKWTVLINRGCRYYTVRKDMKFMLSWQEGLTSERRSEIYCSCHENIKFIYSTYRVTFLLYRHSDDDVFDDFPKIFDHSEDFRRFSKFVLSARWTFPNIFRKFPKIDEGLSRKTRRCFDHTPTNLSII